jgi:hypothetical protein
METLPEEKGIWAVGIMFADFVVILVMECRFCCDLGDGMIVTVCC